MRGRGRNYHPLNLPKPNHYSLIRIYGKDNLKDVALLSELEREGGTRSIFWAETKKLDLSRFTRPRLRKCGP